MLAEFVGDGVDLLRGQDALPGRWAGREVYAPGDVVGESAGRDPLLEYEAQDSVGVSDGLGSFGLRQGGDPVGDVAVLDLADRRQLELSGSSGDWVCWQGPFCR